MSSNPHTPPSSAFQANLRADYTRSLTRRMLAGEGAIELTAYRAGERLSSAIHGVSRSGQLVVADIPNLFHSLGAFHSADHIEVRADIVKDSADHTLGLRLASLHLLGKLRWCRNTADVEALGLQGQLADLVHEVGPRVRVGVVSTERILLHDCSGVTAHGAAIVAEAATTVPSIDALNDAVLTTAAEALADVADAVLDDELSGWTERLDLPEAAGLVTNPAHCVDVDQHCVTVARFTGDQAWVVQVPLPSPPHGLPAQDGVIAWRHLLDSLPTRRTSVPRP
jgi:hypothetical protein